MMFLSMGVAVVCVLEEKLLGHNVDGECARGNPEARERALESIPPGEGTGVSPCLTRCCQSLALYTRAVGQLTFSSRDLVTSIACL